MQNCPITHITLLKHAHATQLYTAGGALLLQDCTREGTFSWLQGGGPGGGVRTKLYGGRRAFFYYKIVRVHFLPDYAAAEAPRRGEASNLVRGASAPIL